MCGSRVHVLLTMNAVRAHPPRWPHSRTESLHPADDFFSKSVHTTFVHLSGNLCLLLSGYALDCRCDLRCIIELGEPVLPWAILFHMLLDVLD